MKALQAECEEMRTAKHAAEAAVAAANAAFSSRGPSPATDEAAQQDMVSPDESAAAASEEGDWLFKCPHRSLSVDVIMLRQNRQFSSIIIKVLNRNILSLIFSERLC